MILTLEYRDRAVVKYHMKKKRNFRMHNLPWNMVTIMLYQTSYSNVWHYVTMTLCDGHIMWLWHCVTVTLWHAHHDRSTRTSDCVYFTIYQQLRAAVMERRSYPVMQFNYSITMVLQPSSSNKTAHPRDLVGISHPTSHQHSSRLISINKLLTNVVSGGGSIDRSHIGYNF